MSSDSRRWAGAVDTPLLNILPVRVNCFVGQVATKHLGAPTKPFCACGADVPKPAAVITHPKAGHQPAAGDDEMRTMTFILAFAFVLTGPSIAGSADRLPCSGAFSYNGAPLAQ